MIDIPYIMQHYVTFDKPIPYKDLFIYPVPLDKYYDFVACYDILNIEKNASGIVEIIQMSYLQFLIHMITMDEIYLTKLVTILEICLHLDATREHELDLVADEQGKMMLRIQNTFITAKEFDDIRRLILYQNIVNYDDKYITPEAQKAMNDYYRISNKGIIMPTLEEQIAKVMSHTGTSKEVILNMTYRGFKLLFDSVIEEVDYTIKKTASLSGMVQFEQPVEHWIYKQKKDKFAGVFVSHDAYKDKMKSVT